MNLNIPRLDDGSPLAESELNEPASWPAPTLRLVQPMAAEAATDLCPDDDNGLPGVPVALAILAGLLLFAVGGLHVLFSYVLPWLGRVLS